MIFLQAHFSESAYFKGILDDLNAQLNNVASDGPKNLRGKEMENKLRILKQRLQVRDTRKLTLGLTRSEVKQANAQTVSGTETNTRFPLSKHESDGL